MDQADASRSTPVSRWSAPHSWWIGEDARSEDSNEQENHSLQFLGSSSKRRLSSQLTSTNEVAGTAGGAPQRDPLRMFGDLPNSSFSPDLLVNPIRREIELHAAEAADAQRSRFAAGGPLAVTFAESRRQSSAHLGGEGQWRDLSARLQAQISNLARERERWEWDRRQLMAQDIDRARDLEGLRRAVEAQSQLVMESVVATQRLAASGSAPASSKEKATVPSHAVLQTAWVPPSMPLAAAAIDKWWGEGRGGAIAEPKHWKLKSSPRVGVGTNDAQQNNGSAEIAEDGNANSSKKSGPWRRSVATSGATAEPRSRRLSAIESVLPEASHEDNRDSAVVVSQAPVSWRRALYNTAVDTASGKFSGGSINNSKHTQSSTATKRLPSTEVVLAPHTLNLARQHVPQASPGGGRESTASSDQFRTSGWRRVWTGGTSRVRGRAGDDMRESRGEVWEWNGRRVVLVLPSKHSPAAEIARARANPIADREVENAETRTEDEQQTPAASAGDDATTTATTALTTTAGEPAAASSSVLPSSLLDDIEEIRAAVEAIAAGVGGLKQLEAPTTLDPARATAAASVTPPAATTAGAREPGSSHQSRPPEDARSPRRSAASPTQTVDYPPIERRQISMPTGFGALLVQQQLQQQQPATSFPPSSSLTRGTGASYDGETSGEFFFHRGHHPERHHEPPDEGNTAEMGAERDPATVPLPVAAELVPAAELVSAAAELLPATGRHTLPLSPSRADEVRASGEEGSDFERFRRGSGKGGDPIEGGGGLADSTARDERDDAGEGVVVEESRAGLGETTGEAEGVQEEAVSSRLLARPDQRDGSSSIGSGEGRPGDFAARCERDGAAEGAAEAEDQTSVGKEAAGEAEGVQEEAVSPQLLASPDEGDNGSGGGSGRGGQPGDSATRDECGSDTEDAVEGEHRASVDQEALGEAGGVQEEAVSSQSLASTNKDGDGSSGERRVSGPAAAGPPVSSPRVSSDCGVASEGNGSGGGAETLEKATE